MSKVALSDVFAAVGVVLDTVEALLPAECARSFNLLARPLLDVNSIACEWCMLPAAVMAVAVAVRATVPLPTIHTTAAVHSAALDSKW